MTDSSVVGPALRPPCFVASLHHSDNNVSVQYNNGFSSDIVLLTLGDDHWGIQLNLM